MSDHALPSEFAKDKGLVFFHLQVCVSIWILNEVVNALLATNDNSSFRVEPELVDGITHLRLGIRI
jgi:hypothetical protein